MQPRVNIDVNTFEKLKMELERRMKRIGFSSVPVIHDVSLRKNVVRFTVGNIENCDLGMIAKMFPESEIFIRDEAKIDVFIKKKTFKDLAVIYLLCITIIILTYRLLIISLRLFS
jgi:ABC-type sulfate/molybdate transport systems ATPase subunit